MGFVNRSVVKHPSSMVTLTLWNAIDLLDHSAVNWIFECSLLICSINSIKRSSPCGQIANTSSMYLHQISGSLFPFSKIFLSKSPMNRLAHDGAIRVPIAVPCIWRWCSSSNAKLFFLRINFIRCIKSSVGGCRTCLVLSAARQASIPSLWGMLVYNDWTSRVTNSVSGCKLSIVCNLFKKVHGILDVRWYLLYQWG